MVDSYYVTSTSRALRSKDYIITLFISFIIATLFQYVISACEKSRGYDDNEVDIYYIMSMQ